MVNRGSIPFQAPEMLVDEVMLPAANNNDLKNADWWSLLMSLFIILNPGLRHPFQNNLTDDSATERDFKELLHQQMVPISSENNQQQHALHYQILRQAFYSNFHYNPDKPISTPILLDLLEKE